MYSILAAITFSFCIGSVPKNINYSKQSFSRDTIIFIDSVNNFNTIDDILALKYFENKIVYIDLWATTCIPCIKEFQFSNKLYSKYQNKGIEFMYICYNYNSSNNKEKREIWKNLVYQNQLMGIHLYAYVMPPDNIIHDEINFDFFNRNSKKPIAYGVPFYIIAKNGKTILKGVSKPSEESTHKLLDSLINETRVTSFSKK